MKIVIPMAGMGKRFLKAGYLVPKPLIEVDGYPIIEHVVRNFSPDDRFIFGVNQEHFQGENLEALFQKIAPQHRAIAMPYQEAGVIAVVQRLFAEIADGEPAVVNYCDFSWVWDYTHFKRTMQETNCDGAVVCYRGFHPHLLGPNQYATLDADGLWMKEILEKHSWHDNKQQDWTSSGTYYFKKGAHIKKYFDAIAKHPDLKINGEHYVSQIFQLMKADGLRIYIYEIPFMLQWGTPEDLEEYRYWSDYFSCKAAVQPAVKKHDMTVMMLMAGAGKRFTEAGYDVPKPYIPVDDGTLVAKAARALPQGLHYVFVTREELRYETGEAALTAAFPDTTWVHLRALTEGQACTALAGRGQVDPEKPLLIGACDHAMLDDSGLFEKMTAAGSGIDALIWTYRRNPMVRRNPQAYGWVATDGATRATKVSVKVPMPGDPAEHHAIIGAFWFRKAHAFFEHAEKMIQANSRINNEFYIDECMNFLIRAGMSVHVFETDRYASWGTPEDLKTYQYWDRFFAQAWFHPYSRIGDRPKGLSPMKGKV